ncbi:MAG: hypothetical protein HGA39_02510 [Coriobacteriia bacterium]|nr:hypothetical protein [Coriobacteriia bacterium]
MAEFWRPSGGLPTDVLTSSGASRLNIVSGPSGCGKTSWCLALLAQAQLTGVEFHGVVCPPVFENGRKTGIDVAFLGGEEDGTRLRLAERRDLSIPSDPSTFRLAWNFDSQLMQRVERHFDLLRASEYLIVDEIGPLELLSGVGWQSALSVIDSGVYRTAFVVVRPSLLEIATTRWPSAEVIQVCAETGEPRSRTGV